MTITSFISTQPAERQKLLQAIHEIIISTDQSVKPRIGSMMRVEMILYDAPGSFKYGLSSVKKYMSLHLMPIYASADLHKKYTALLPKANFQKGCINFNNDDEMPLAIVKQLLEDCSKIDLQKIREEYLKSKKK